MLRGPQGTLYGGSSQGGTVRFITPAPSLTALFGLRAASRPRAPRTAGPTTRSASPPAARSSRTSWASGSSGIYRKTAGWIDALSRYDGHQFGENVNWFKARALRLAVAWAATSKARITPGLYMSRDYSNADDTIWTATPANSWTGGLVRNGARPTPRARSAPCRRPR